MQTPALTHFCTPLHHLKGQTLYQSNICAKRTFKAWFYELRQLFSTFKSIFNYLDLKTPRELIFEIDREEAEMYYNGGYSPKMVFYEINRIPVDIEII